MENLVYRPSEIIFELSPDNSGFPEMLGEFPSEIEAKKFIAAHFTALNEAVNVYRRMDYKEIKVRRETYENILENIVPDAEIHVLHAESEYQDKKKKLADRNEYLRSRETEAKNIAKEVKKGVVEIELDQEYTYKIPYKGRYYHVTYIDKVLKLAKIQDIPEHEKGDLYVKMAQNEQMIDHGETKPQEGKEE